MSPQSKGKKRQRASSGGAQGNYTRGPTAARAIRRPKGKQTQKEGLLDAVPPPPEEKSDEFS